MKEYINKLIDNLQLKTKKIEIDLILDGGAFSGSYLIGNLLYFKELERRNIVKIKRFSGCSIGSLLSLIYKLDILEIHSKVYKIIKFNLKNGNMKSYYKILKILQKHMPEDFYKSCNNNLFITYFNVNNPEQIVKSTYKSNNDLIQTIKKSSHIPYAISGKCLYKKRYFDGIYPFIFENDQDRNVLFLNLCGNEYILKMLYIKSETNNTERIMEGILKCHTYFFYEKNTHYINNIYDNSITSLIQNFILKIRIFISKQIVYCIQYINYINTTKNMREYSYISNYVKRIIQYILHYNSN